MCTIANTAYCEDVIKRAQRRLHVFWIVATETTIRLAFLQLPSDIHLAQVASAKKQEWQLKIDFSSCKMVTLIVSMAIFCLLIHMLYFFCMWRSCVVSF